MAETWRVVFADGRVFPLELVWVGTLVIAKIYGLMAEGVALSGTGADVYDAVADLSRCRRGCVAEIVPPGEPTRAELAAQLATVTRERDVLRAQQAPLLDAHDALVAAARAAGWTGAGATGAELVAWVRRGEREACARVADDEARDSEGNEGAVCAAQSIAATIRGREGGE